MTWEDDESYEVSRKRLDERRRRAILARFNPVRIYEAIRAKVVGQDVLAAMLAREIVNSILLKRTNQPRCKLLLSGNPGVGKTYLAEVTAKALYPEKAQPYVIVSCGEISHEQDFNRILFGVSGEFQGSQDGLVANFIQENPEGGVIIFDEFDKLLQVLPSAKNKFLNLLQKGVLPTADNQGQYDLSNFVLFFTSNEMQEELTKVADKILGGLEVGIVDGKLQIPTAVKPLKQMSSDVLMRGGLFDGPFLQRFDFVASVKTLSPNEVLRLSTVLIKKYISSSVENITGVNYDASSVILAEEIRPWLAEMIEDFGARSAEIQLAQAFDADVSDIVTDRIDEGLDAQFRARFEWDYENDKPRVVDDSRG